MTKRTSAILKGYFNTGDMPTEANFADLIDSFTFDGATLTVAASNASQKAKDFADYVCDGINDEVQIQAAIDALSSVGGKILFTEGNYYCDAAGTYIGDDLSHKYSILVTTQGPIHFEGVRGSTKISFRDGIADNNLFMFYVRGTLATRRMDVTSFDGIYFEGNAGVAECLSIFYAQNNFVSYCIFDNGGNSPGQSTLDIGFNGGRSVVTHNTFLGLHSLSMGDNNFIITNNIFDASDAGVTDEWVCWLDPDYDVAWDETYKYSVFSALVSNNTFIGGGRQVVLSGTRGCIVSGNTFSFQKGTNLACVMLVSTYVPGFPDDGYNSIGNIVLGNTFTDYYYAIKLEGTYTTGCQYNLIAFNTINAGNYPLTNCWYGIIETAGCDYNLIAYNRIFARITIAAKVGANTIIRDNIGYVTESSGAEASTADGGAINHGLATTPTMAVVSGSVAGEIVTVSVLDTTHFHVAIKKADGSAGTTQTVYWRAEV